MQSKNLLTKYVNKMHTYVSGVSHNFFLKKDGKKLEFFLSVSSIKVFHVKIIIQSLVYV